MKHTPPLNQWQHPVHIPRARRVKSGSRRMVLPIPLVRRVEPRATLSEEAAFYATVLAVIAPIFWLLWRAAFER